MSKVENDTAVSETESPAKPDERALNRNINMVMRIPVQVKVVLGSATMPVSQLIKLGRGAVIPLDRMIGDAVDIVVNGQVIARGEIVVVDDNGSRFGVSLTEVLTREHHKSL